MTLSVPYSPPMVCACCGKSPFTHLLSAKVEIGNTPTTVIATPYSNDYRIDVLIEGRSVSWNPSGNKSTATPVTYSFAHTPAYLSGDNAQGFATFTTAQKEGVRSFLSLANSIINLNFIEVTESVSPTTPYGQIRMANVMTSSAGYAFMPGADSPEAGDVFISTSTIDSTYSLGSFDYDTLIHEIAHAIGLKHPGNYNDGSAPSTQPGNYLANSEDSKLISVVSYVEHPQGLQRIDFGLYDLLALDYLYGLRPYKTDNTSYVYNDSVGRQLQTIYDTGGTDTINFSQVSTSTTINLNGGSSSSAGRISSATTSERAQNNIQIAFGTEIENVIGSPQADQITGNGIANTITGGGGNDQINGGAGIDTAIYSGTTSQYQIRTGNQTTIVDITTGRDGTDTLSNIERLKFFDKNIALDLAPSQSAGQTALLLGAVLPGQLAFDPSKQALLGGVINLFDQNFSLAQLSGAILRLPIWDTLTNKVAPTTADVATYLVNNVYGGSQTSAITNAAINAMTAETPATQGSYLASLAASTANQTHIDLVGIQATGLTYL